MRKNQLKNTLNTSSNETQDQLEAAKKDREALIREFDVKKMSIDNERDSAIEEIMNNYNTDIELIDDTWSSEKKRQEYSRPSPTLMNKRKQAITLLKAKKFKESSVINEEAKQLEEQEIQAAYNKLEADYQKCIKKRDDKKAADIRAVQQLHEKRMNDFQRQKTLALKKFDNRIATLEEKIKSKASSQAKTKTTNKKTPNTTSRSISNSGNASPRKTCDIVLQNEPLKLPQLKINHSRPQTSLCQSRNGKRTSFSKTTPF